MTTLYWTWSALGYDRKFRHNLCECKNVSYSCRSVASQDTRRSLLQLWRSILGNSWFLCRKKVGEESGKEIEWNREVFHLREKKSLLKRVAHVTRLLVRENIAKCRISYEMQKLSMDTKSSRSTAVPNYVKNKTSIPIFALEGQWPPGIKYLTTKKRPKIPKTHRKYANKPIIHRKTQKNQKAIEIPKFCLQKNYEKLGYQKKIDSMSILMGGQLHTKNRPTLFFLARRTCFYIILILFMKLDFLLFNKQLLVSRSGYFRHILGVLNKIRCIHGESQVYNFLLNYVSI